MRLLNVTLFIPTHYLYLTRKHILLIVVSAVISIGGCTSSKHNSLRIHKLHSTQGDNRLVSEEIPPDTALNNMLHPYKDSLESYMNTFVGISKGVFTLDRPEGSLNNLVADIVRRRSSRELKTNVDVSILQYSMIRDGLPAGTLRVADIYRLLPDERRIVVAMMDGNRLLRLADQIAEQGGGAVSGLRMQIDDGQATGVLAGSRTIVPDNRYLLATTAPLVDNRKPVNYYRESRAFAFSSDTVNRNLFAILENAELYRDLNLELRDIVIEYIQNHGYIMPQLDNRIR